MKENILTSRNSSQINRTVIHNVTEDLTLKTNSIINQQNIIDNSMNNDIGILNKKIEQLKEENNQLKGTILQLQNKLLTLSNNLKQLSKDDQNDIKKIETKYYNIKQIYLKLYLK